MIPAGAVTFFSGEGGLGKSAVALQLGLAVALGSEWLGRPVQGGPVLALLAEDDGDEVGRRLIRIAAGEGVELGEATGFHVITSDQVAGGPALATVENGVARPTKAFDAFVGLAADVRPSLIIFDPVAELAAIDENKRSEVASFMRLLGDLARRTGAAVLLIGHPSLTGIASGTGMSGSTAWANSARSRLVLTAPDQHDPARRRLALMKSNYGPMSDAIELRMADGRFVAITASSAEAREVEAKAEAAFISALRRLDAEGRRLSDAPSPTFAPSVIVAEPEGKGLDKKALRAAMARLFSAGRLRVEETGPASRRRSRIIEVKSNVIANADANGMPTHSNEVCPHTPHTPRAVGRPAGVGTPRLPNACGEDAEWSDPMAGLEPDDWRSDVDWGAVQ